MCCPVFVAVHTRDTVFHLEGFLKKCPHNGAGAIYSSCFNTDMKETKEDTCGGGSGEVFSHFTSNKHS